MNIGEAITAPFQYANWFPKVAKASLISILLCFTVVGIFVALPNLLGWSKHIAEERMRGNSELPDFSLSYIGEGWRILVGQFIFGIIAMVAMIPIMIVIGGLSFVLGKVAAPLAVVVSLLGMVVYLAFAVGLGLASPIITCRIMFDGDTTAGVRILDAIKLARANLGTCFMFFVATICISFLGNIAGYTVIGMFIFTMGYLAVANGVALAQFRQTGIN